MRQALYDHLRKCEIVSQLTPLETLQLNGVFERGNQTLLDIVRSMMSHADLPLSFRVNTLEKYVFSFTNPPRSKCLLIGLVFSRKRIYFQEEQWE